MRIPLRLLAISAVSVAAACGGGDSSSTGPTNNPGNPGNPSNPVLTTSVTLGNDFFSPASIQVSPGATVTWNWPSDVVTHNVTFSDVSSGDQGPGASFSKTFPTAGTFSYHCTIHSGMNGTVLVQ